MLIITPLHRNEDICGGRFVKLDFTQLSQGRHHAAALAGDFESMQNYCIGVAGGSRFRRAVTLIDPFHSLCFNLLPGPA
jgi:hypothetical protein